MKGLLVLCDTSDEAGARGKALNKNGWNVVGTGQLDGLEIRQGDDFVSHLAGSWAILASREEIFEP